MCLSRSLPRIAAVLACLALVAACTSEPDSSEAEKPTLAEAAQQLVADGDALLTSLAESQTGTASATERAEQDKGEACLPDEVQRFFRAEGNMAGRHAAFNIAGLMQTHLRALGYEDLVDDLDIRDQKLSVVAGRNPKTDITYVVAVQLEQKPNIRIVGKTACYKQAG